MSTAQITNSIAHPVRYDRTRRRLWILGQRCHHGATGAVVASVGAVLAGAAVSGLAALRITTRSLLALTATGGLLMVHDWKDRSIWFEPGPGHQP